MRPLTSRTRSAARSRRSRRLGRSGLAALVAGVGSAAGAGAAPAATFQRGDVFLTGAGVIQEYAPDGQLRNQLASSSGANRICFTPNGTELVAPGVGLFSPTGALLPSSWASVTATGGCVADGYGHVYVASRTSAGYTIDEFTLHGGAIQSFLVPAGGFGPVALDLAPDSCTLYWASYLGNGIGRTDGCTGTQEPAFSSDQLVDDLRVLPDWSVAVTVDGGVQRFDSSGQQLWTARADPGTVSLRFMSLAPDGMSLWASSYGTAQDGSGGAYRFDVQGGRQEAHWSTGFGPLAVFGPPLIGDADIAATVDSDAGGTAEVFQTQAGYSGNISRLHVYVDASSTAGQVVVGVYSDRSGQPRTLQAQAVTRTLRAGAWNTVDVPAIPVTAGQHYWIAVLAPKGSDAVRFRSASGGQSQTSQQHNLTSLPSQWSGGAAWTTSLSGYGS